MFLFSLQYLFETFLILRIIQRDNVINVKKFSCKVPFLFYRNLTFLDRFPKKKAHISNLIKLGPVGVDFFHADGQTASHDKANGRFSQFCERV